MSYRIKDEGGTITLAVQTLNVWNWNQCSQRGAGDLEVHMGTHVKVAEIGVGGLK